MGWASALGSALSGAATTRGAKKAKEEKRQTQQSIDNLDVNIQRLSLPEDFEGPLVPRKHKGGRIPKNGIYRLLKDEYVIDAKTMRKVDGARNPGRKSSRKSTRKSGRR